MEWLRVHAARFRNNCIWSLAGWCASWKSEATLRQWTLVNLISFAFTWVVPMSTAERALIFASGMMILVAELLNTAVEEAVNRISTARHPLAEKAKDAGSAAVAVAAITAGGVWLLVLLG